MEEYRALSIVYPAVDNILSGKKLVEIRSWVPPRLPIKDLVLVENNKYLHDGEIDSSGFARAIVDVDSYKEWTYEDYCDESDSVHLGRQWKPGYYIWYLSNVRKIAKPAQCLAQKGIYTIFL